MRILVVGDDRKVASFLKKGLREEGYSVDVAHDGEEGKMKAPVYDYDLPLTARDGQEDIVQGLDAGAVDYLTRPFGFDELLDRVKHVASRRGERLDLTPKELRLCWVGNILQKGNPA